MKIKICGMKFGKNIVEIAALKPNYLGFIFYEASPRNFEGFIAEIDEKIKKTGVFVDASVEFILEKAANYNLEVIQLHGVEKPVLCTKLKKKYLEVIKVFSIGEAFDFKKLQPYEGKVDFFLFDTKGSRKGGNGIAFNWKILEKYPSRTPFFLSGGIGLKELEEVKKLQEFFISQGKENLFHGLDLNSRLEEFPGQKNVRKIIEFQDKLNKLQIS